MKNLNNLEKKLRIKFNNQNLLAQALIHRSYLNEANKKLRSNETLEFLGDAVLSFIISDWLFREYPGFNEGDLTNLRSNLVKTRTLAKIAQNLDLGEYLLLSKGERESEGQRNPALLANCLEATIAAIFLDQGLGVANEFIKSNFEPLLKKVDERGRFKDYKSLLQEKIQAQTKRSPVYKTIKEEGPDHAKTFTVGVSSQGKLIATGQGRTKQAAEEKAAKAALEKLGFKK